MALATKHVSNIANAEFLVICSYCKKVKQENMWVVLSKDESAQFHGRLSHGLCQKCMHLYYPDLMDD